MHFCSFSSFLLQLVVCSGSFQIAVQDVPMVGGDIILLMMFEESLPPLGHMMCTHPIVTFQMLDVWPP